MNEWKLVPVEPTDEMARAASRLDLSYMPDQAGADRAAIYRAMLAAAPAPVADLLAAMKEVLRIGDRKHDAWDRAKAAIAAAEGAAPTWLESLTEGDLSDIYDSIPATEPRRLSRFVQAVLSARAAHLRAAPAAPRDDAWTFTHDDADRLFGRPGDVDCQVAQHYADNEEMCILVSNLHRMKRAAHDLADQFAAHSARPADPLPEPVAWQYRARNDTVWLDCSRVRRDELLSHPAFEVRPLYAADPLPEPVACELRGPLERNIKAAGDASLQACLAAVHTLRRLGYTYVEGAELWRPPLGRPPEKPKCQGYLTECPVCKNDPARCVGWEAPPLPPFGVQADPEDSRS